MLLMAGLLLAADSQAFAQKKDYAPGEKIEYKSSGYPETWEPATFVRATPDGSQPIIRQMPNAFHKDGYQRAASWTDIRPPAAAPNEAAPPNPRPEANAEALGTRGIADRGNVETPRSRTTTEAGGGPGSGLMTQAEVLAFLRTRVGNDPWQNPSLLAATKKSLAETIKARGLNFRFGSSDAAFQSALGKYGPTSDIVFPLRDNYGAPTRQAWLMGAWQLGKIGAAVDYERNGAIYRQAEIGVANVGALLLNANGSYAWNSAGAPSTNGRWRAATREEMRSVGGDGIVLLGAKGGYDWLVTKNRRTPNPGEWIDISELGTRQINEYGSRRGQR